MSGAPQLDLDTYLSMPRLSGLAVSPDGSRLVTCVAEVSGDGKRFVSALWELDPSGEGSPRRLTRSKEGERFSAFLPDGSLLFTSARADPDAPDGSRDEDDDRARLRLLPAAGGEARVVADPPFGVDAVVTASGSASDVVVYVSGRWPDSMSVDEDAARSRARRKLDIGAQLFGGYPIRYWDRYLPTEQPHLFAARAPAAEGRLEDARDLTPDAGGALAAYNEMVGFDLSADGSTVVCSWRRSERALDPHFDLVAIDVATGERRALLAADDADFIEPAVSPDGQIVACVKQTVGSPELSHRLTLWIVELATGAAREVPLGVDSWPHAPVWSPNGEAVFVTVDERGETAVYRVDVDVDRAGSGPAVRLTSSGWYGDVCVAPDGSALYAVRTSLASPPEVVALDPAAPLQAGRPIRTPGMPVPVSMPGRVKSITAVTGDGVEIQSWLVLPTGAAAGSPAPLVVFIHGGPVGAWGEWHWRWNPQVLAARGYAVLLPNPAISTGFGQAMVDRGRGRWGEEPYTDLLAAVEGAEVRDDIDENRVAAMGGSFGGYMANWVAGHTDRFRCIVTHASLWDLEQFHGTTDTSEWCQREFGDFYADRSRYAGHSPSRFIGSIRTPMLVIHGELDQRVPVGESLRLWTDLMAHGVEAKFLYFPDENHWVQRPPNIRIWYETVLAWLDHHLLGQPWRRPSLL